MSRISILTIEEVLLEVPEEGSKAQAYKKLILELRDLIKSNAQKGKNINARVWVIAGSKNPISFVEKLLTNSIDALVVEGDKDLTSETLAKVFAGNQVLLHYAG